MPNPRRARSRRVLIGLVPRLIQNAIDNRTRLPATIVEAWTFGSILRTDAPHDLDIVLLYDQSSVQKDRWARFSDIFSTGYWGKETVAQSAQETLHKVLNKEYYQRDRLSLSETLHQPHVARIVEALRLNVDWAGCYGWTEYIRGEHGDGFFSPGMDKIFRRFIVGRLAQQGLQVQFMERRSFRTRDSMHLGKVKNYVKVWDLTTPMTAIIGAFKASRSHYVKEFDHLRQQVVQGIGELTSKLDEIGDLAKDASVDIPFQNLIPDEPSPEMPMDERLLRKQCGELRTSVKQIDKLNAFFISAQDALRSNKTIIAIVGFLLNQISSPLTEDDVRGFLRRLRLPEHDFVTYRGHSVYPGAEEARIKILEQEQNWARAHTLELKIRRLLPQKKRWQIVLNPRLTGEVIHTADGDAIHIVGTQIDLWLTYFVPANINLQSNSWSKLEASGWTVRFDKYEGETASIGMHFDLTTESWRTVKSKVNEAIRSFALAVPPSGAMEWEGTHQ